MKDLDLQIEMVENQINGEEEFTWTTIGTESTERLVHVPDPNLLGIVFVVVYCSKYATMEANLYLHPRQNEKFKAEYAA